MWWLVAMLTTIAALCVALCVALIRVRRVVGMQRRLIGALSELSEALEAAVDRRDAMLEGRKRQLLQVVPTLHRCNLLHPNIVPHPELVEAVVAATANDVYQQEAIAAEWLQMVRELPTSKGE